MATSSRTTQDPSQVTVSIILPIYNAEPYLDQALRSAREQTHAALQIICVNDGSTDGSPTIMRAHAAEDARVEVLDQANAGYGAAMNNGLSHATGAWVAILEPDDWIEPGMVADMLACAARYERPGARIDMVKCPYWVIREPDTPREAKLPCSYRGRVRPRRQPFTVEEAPHLLGHHPSIWSALYRTDFLRERGIRFREIPGAGWADNPFLVETLCQAKAICYLPQAYYCYREETPEKTAAVATRSPLMPLDRWLDMAEVLDRLQVKSPVVWREMHYRAFTYVGLARGGRAWDACPPEVRERAAQVFARLDPSLVWSEERVTVTDKMLFANVRGLTPPRLSPWPYRLRLVAEGLYNVWNKGPAATLKMVARQLSR